MQIALAAPSGVAPSGDGRASCRGGRIYSMSMRTAADLERADVEYRAAMDRYINEFNRECAEAKESYVRALRSAEVEYRKALEGPRQRFAAARAEAERKLNRFLEG